MVPLGNYLLPGPFSFVCSPLSEFRGYRRFGHTSLEPDLVAFFPSRYGAYPGGSGVLLTSSFGLRRPCRGVYCGDGSDPFYVCSMPVNVWS